MKCSIDCFFHLKDLPLKERFQSLVKCLGHWWFKSFQLLNGFENKLPLRGFILSQEQPFLQKV